MPGDSESDVFPALFGALRDRLAVRVSTLDGATDVDQVPPPSRVLTASSSPSDALLKSLSASDSSVGSRVLQEIRADVRANKLQLLRRKRLRLRKTREAKQRQKQRLDAVASAECDAVLLDATTHGQKFQLFLADTHAKAVARLRTLFYECAAEMKKALVRMENVAADTTEESESMVEELLRRYEWELFLVRLRQDCGGDIDASLLVPSSSSFEIRSCSLHSLEQSGSGKVKAALQRVLQEHGPALENGDSLLVRSVISLKRSAPTRRAPEKSSRSTPSLHFGASAAEMWTEMVGALMRPPNASKPRRTMSSSSSTRRIRRLPPSKVGAGDPSISSFSTGGDFHSSDDTDRIDLGPYYELADSNIYFDIAEYEQNFAAVMQNYATSATMDAASMPFPVDHTALASARRSLREINTILARSRAQCKETQSADTIFARQMHSEDSDAGSNQPKVASGDHSIFARASVLQLVQTCYYSENFVSLLTPADIDILRKLYPTTLFGEGCVSTLYVPVAGGERKREDQQEEPEAQATFSEVAMHPLDDHAIHELLLIYVARGKYGLTPGESSSVDSNEQLTSLAYSDAVNTLVPYRQEDFNPRSRVPFCVIKNARGLCNQSKESSGPDNSFISEEFQQFTDADAVFVECVVCSTPSGEQGSPRQPLPLTNVKTKAIVDMLGTSCMWRSCITSSDSHNLQINSNLCKWHSSLQHFLEADESMQYMPSESRMREAFLAAESDSMAEKTKYVIQTSSSLLEELSSRHLPQSIKAFFEHVLSAASNHTFQTEYVGTVVEGFASLSDLEQTYHELQRQVNLSEDIIGTENSVTRELRQLHQLTVYPGVEDSFIQRGFVDIEELQSDIRTGDLGLLLRLSQQKLQLLERRRKEEENLVVQRLAPSTSLPSMSISEQPGLSSVYDVIHVMRKGRQSLLRQQRQDALDGGRNGYKRSHGMERCASDLVYRVSPYEAKAVPTAKYRAGGGGSNGKKVTRKHSDR